MNDTKKCIIIVDENLPLGLIANTAAILGASFGKLHPETIREDITDKSERIHRGIVAIPITVLKGSAVFLNGLIHQLSELADEELTYFDFSDVAQQCNDYDDYICNAKQKTSEAYHYYGLLIYGSKKKINKISGSLPLLR